MSECRRACTYWDHGRLCADVKPGGHGVDGWAEDPESGDGVAPLSASSATEIRSAISRGHNVGV